MTTATPTAPFLVRALYAFVAEGRDELEFPKDRIISVISQQTENWYRGQYVDDAGRTRVGMFPIVFVEHYQPNEMPAVTELHSVLSDCDLLQQASSVTAVRGLDGQTPLSTDSGQNTILHSCTKGNVERSYKNQQATQSGQTEASLLFENDEALISWYRDLNFDSEIMISEENSNDQRPPQRDSGIGLQNVGSSSDHDSPEQITPEEAGRPTSIFQQSQNPIQVLRRLRTDLGLPAYPELSLWDLQQSECASEVEWLEALIDEKLELKELPPVSLQATLTNRLERLLRSLDRSKETDSSRTIPGVGQRCTNLVNDLVLLLNPNRNCVVCGHEKSAINFGGTITNSCDHDTNTCKSCLQKWICSQLSDKGWDKLKCSECSELLQHSDVKTNAAPEIFQR
jgi:hypothetical protein